MVNQKINCCEVSILDSEEEGTPLGILYMCDRVEIMQRKIKMHFCQSVEIIMLGTTG
jgi:hypothetical protein